VNYDKLYAMLGLAVKSGKCTIGSTACVEMLKRKRAAAVFMDGSAQNTVDKIKNHCGETPLILLDQGRLGAAIGREGTKVLALTDKGFAQAVLKMYQGFGVDRGEAD